MYGPQFPLWKGLETDSQVLAKCILLSMCKDSQNDSEVRQIYLDYANPYMKGH